MAGTVYINPTAKAGGTGTQASPYNSWAQVNFTAGTTYLQAAGTTYAGAVYVGTKATAAAPIVIGSYGTGAAPVINGGVTFDGATYVSFSGFQVTNSTGAGIVLENGANDVTISGNTITSSAMGIWIGNAAGTTNTIQGNTISNNAQYGIAMNEVTGSGTVISNNVVTGNGLDGINIDGNQFTVKNNTVTDNGLSDFGSSGIHIYASSATDTFGAFNVITGNVCTNNHDFYEEDGNGIESDQWTHDNTISDNFCYANDGAGIILYDSYNNTVSDNDIGGNDLDPDHTHTTMGDLCLNTLLGLTNDNTIQGNAILSTSSVAPAIFVLGSNNTFLSNVIENLAGGPIYDWQGLIGAQTTGWGQYTSSTNTPSGVPLTAPPAGVTPSFLFPTGATVTLDGKVVTLVGWAPGYGLLGG